MIEVSEHAKKSMLDDTITEDEVKKCLQNGELEVRQVVNGEMRYGKKLELKDKTIMVIYTYGKNIKRIITCYIIWRKKWEKQ